MTRIPVRALTPLVVVAGTLLLIAGPAGAQVAEDGNAAPDVPVGAVLTVNNTLVTVLLGVVAPIVTGFLLRPANPPVVKVFVATVVGAVFHAVAEAVQADGTAALSQEWLVKLALVLAFEFGSYFAVWNPVFASRGGLNAATGPGVIPAGSRTA